MSKEQLLKEFDIIFENLKLKDVQIAGLLILLNKAIDQTREETIRGEMERLVKFNQLPPQVELENPYYWQGYQKAKDDLIKRFKNLTN